jgi:hypothetical protein
MDQDGRVEQIQSRIGDVRRRLQSLNDSLATTSSYAQPPPTVFPLSGVAEMEKPTLRAPERPLSHIHAQLALRNAAASDSFLRPTPRSNSPPQVASTAPVTPSFEELQQILRAKLIGAETFGSDEPAAIPPPPPVVAPARSPPRQLRSPGRTRALRPDAAEVTTGSRPTPTIPAVAKNLVGSFSKLKSDSSTPRSSEPLMPTMTAPSTRNGDESELTTLSGAEVFAILRLRGVLVSNGNTGEHLLPASLLHQMFLTKNEVEQLTHLREVLKYQSRNAPRGVSAAKKSVSGTPSLRASEAALHELPQEGKSKTARAKTPGQGQTTPGRWR